MSCFHTDTVINAFVITIIMLFVIMTVPQSYVNNTLINVHDKNHSTERMPIPCLVTL